MHVYQANELVELYCHDFELSTKAVRPPLCDGKHRGLRKGSLPPYLRNPPLH